LDPFGQRFLVLFFLLCLYAIVTAAQSALLRLSLSELEENAEDGDLWSARLLRHLNRRVRVSDKARTVTTLLGCLCGALSGIWFAGPLASWLEEATSLHSTVCSAAAFALVIIALGTVLQLFAVQLPRRAARKNPMRIARSFFPIWLLLSGLFMPLTAVIVALRNVLLRLLHLQPEESDTVTEEEIRQLVDEGEERGVIESDEKEMIENIFEFNNLSAQDVMTHRTDAYVLQVEDDRETILSTIRESGCSRLPVYDEDMDDIIGVLSVKKYLLNLQSEAPKPIRELVREAFFVPETVQADALFRDMQKKKQHMAIVVDEYGGFSGLVTMEDLLEEIVGNIYDEFDPAAVQEIVKLEDNLWRVAGTVDLETLAEALDAELPLEEEYDTLGGLIFDQLATIPEDGARPELDAWNLHIAVELIEDHRVEWALVSKLQPEAEDQQEDDHDAD